MLTALRGRVSGTALADADRQGGTMPEAAAAFLETCRLWWHLVTTWPYSLLWSLAVPGTVSAFLRKKRPMIPYRRARAVVTWILDSGIAKTIERTLFSIAILSGLLVFLYAVVAIANQNVHNLNVTIDSLLKVMSRRLVEDAKARASTPPIPAPIARALLIPYYMKDGKRHELTNRDSIIALATQNSFYMPEFLIANKGRRRNPSPLEVHMFLNRKLDSSTWPQMPSSSDPEFRTELYLAPSTGFGGFLGAFVEPRDNPVHLPVFAGRFFAGAIPDDPTRVKLTLTYGEEPTSITFFLITQTSPTP